MNLHQRIDDFLEERANAESDWDEQQSAFTDFVEMELLEQRKACADAIQNKWWKCRTITPTIEELMELCLNAVEEK